MRNRTVTFGLLAMIFISFAVYFLIYNMFTNSGKLIEEQLNNLVQYVQQGKWDDAEESADKVLDLWNNEKYLLALNYAEADYSLFLDNLLRIQGAIKTKDDVETVCQALSILNLWKKFNKVIPEP